MLTKLLILLEMLTFCAAFLVVLYGIRKLGDIIGVGSGHDTSSDGGTSSSADCRSDARRKRFGWVQHLTVPALRSRHIENLPAARERGERGTGVLASGSRKGSTVAIDGISGA